MLNRCLTERSVRVPQASGGQEWLSWVRLASGLSGRGGPGISQGCRSLKSEGLTEQRTTHFQIGSPEQLASSCCRQEASVPCHSIGGLSVLTTCQLASPTVVVQEQQCLTSLGSHTPSFVKRLWVTKVSLSSVRGNCMRALVPASTGTILEAGYCAI